MNTLALEDKLTRTWIINCMASPLPEGHETRFGLTGKFHRYENLEAMEADHMEHWNGKRGPFIYTELDYEKKKENFLEGDEFWKVHNTIYVVRDGNIITKEGHYRFSMPHGVEKTFSYPDPEYCISLDVI